MRVRVGFVLLVCRQVSTNHDLMRIYAPCQALRCRHSNADLHFFSAPDGEDRRGEVIAKHSNADLQYGPKIHVITSSGKGLPDEVIQPFITLILKSIIYSDFELLNNWIAAP